METLEEKFARLVAYIREDMETDIQLNKIRLDMGITVVPQLTSK